MDSRTEITMSCVGDAYVSRTSEISIRSDSPERSLGTRSLFRGCRRLRPTGRAQSAPWAALVGRIGLVFDIGWRLANERTKGDEDGGGGKVAVQQGQGVDHEVLAVGDERPEQDIHLWSS